jgi:hypothetical protein
VARDGAQAQQRPGDALRVTELAEHAQGHRALLGRLLEVGLQPAGVTQVAVGARDRRPVAGGLGDGQALCVQLHRAGVSALLAGHAAEHLQRAGHATGIAQFPVQPQRGFEPAHGRRVVALQQGKAAAAEQRLCPQRGGGIRACRDRGVHPLADLVVVAAKVSKAPQRAGDPKRGVHVTAIAGELQRRAKVRRLSVQAVQLAFEAQGALAATFDPGRDLFHQAGKAPQVGTAGSLLLGGLGQALQRVLADSAQQVVAGVAADVIHPQQRLVGEPCQQAERAPGGCRPRR